MRMWQWKAKEFLNLEQQLGAELLGLCPKCGQNKETNSLQENKERRR